MKTDGLSKHLGCTPRSFLRGVQKEFQRPPKGNSENPLRFSKKADARATLPVYVRGGERREENLEKIKKSR